MTVRGHELLEKLSPRAVELLEACGRLSQERGESAYLVGGSVRDLILGRGETDLDIVVEGDGMAVAQALARGLGGALTRHHAFQTARVDTPDAIRVDVATARSEIYPRPGFLPRVVAGSLREDLERRDFTINTIAIALNPASWGELIDPEGGIADLRAELVRILHSRSFADDPTRILRALRFVARFGYTLEEQTADQLREAVLGGYLDTVTGGRVRRELAYLFSESPVEGPLLLQAHAVLAALHEGLEARRACLEALARNREWYAGIVASSAPAADSTDAPASLSPRVGAIDARGRQGEGSADVDPGWALVLSACAWNLGAQERWRLASHLELSRKEREPLVESGAAWRRALQEWQEQKEESGRDAMVLDAIFSRFAPGTLLVLLSIPEIKGDEDLYQGLRQFMEHTQWVRPTLRGGDLIDLGVAEGPAVGQVLEILRRARVNGTVEDVDGERRLALDWLGSTCREDN
jgi:tRNA nucleotidyltransferase (CCA-adding enzyme)